MTRALLGEAHKSLYWAEHLFNVLYPFTNDPKLLVGILANLHKAQVSCLEYLAEQKKIKLATHRERISWLNETSKIQKDVITALLELDHLMELQKTCPVEFVRKDKFVLCTDAYEVKTISSKEINNHLAKTKVFIEKITSGLAL